ncbi:hypothetical protein [Pyxidicoccus trucidator]|jgi:hypothetical protein|uniref:hypothetical protein n=1 Tax=Pyxidicoccus trucidator TaxID=2709662 RepID=UPI001F071283|nr:hypothetical protein [Pyxidicoccus trucidator]
MEMNIWSPGLAGMQGMRSTPSRTQRALRDPARTRWEAQSWRRQLRDPGEYETPVARGALVQALVAEGLTVDAEVARYAGTSEDKDIISVAQVVRFADTLALRMALARTDDEVLQLAHLRRNAVELAERMIEWANAGRL